MLSQAIGPDMMIASLKQDGDRLQVCADPIAPRCERQVTREKKQKAAARAQEEIGSLQDSPTLASRNA